MTRRLVPVLAALLLIASTGVAAAAMLNHDATAVPDERIKYTLEKDSHNLSWDSARTYEGDNGELKTLDARINTTYDNPYGFVASDIAFEDAGAFPHDAPDTSALEASEWSKDASGTAGTATIADVETASGVDAVRFSTSSQSSSDVAKATFSNFSITSDENKRYLQVIADVETLDSGATVNISVMDADGDAYVAQVDPDGASSEHLIGNATGEGLVFQRQLGKMTLGGSGDGTMDDIEKVQIAVSDADAAVSISALNVDAMSPWTLGERLADTDGDDELETETVTETKEGGKIWLKSLDSMGESFSMATIHGLTSYYDMDASTLDDEDTKVTFSDEAPNPAYEGGTATVYYRMGIPSAYELNPSQAERVAHQKLSQSAIISVEYAEATGDTNFSEIDDSAYTDLTSSFDTADANVSVDDTIQPGQQSVTKWRVQLTKAQRQSFMTSGGGAGMFAGSGGGGGGSIIDMLIGIPQMAFYSFLGIIGLRKRRSGS